MEPADVPLPAALTSHPVCTALLYFPFVCRALAHFSVVMNTPAGSFTDLPAPITAPDHLSF